MPHIIGIVIALFLAVLLFTKRGKSSADLVLAIWLLLISFHLFSYYLLATAKFLEWPYVLGLEIAMPFIHGPFLYLYTAALIGKQTRWRGLLHFLPVVLINLSLLAFFLLPWPEKIAVYQNGGAGYAVLLAIIHGAVLPSGIAYIVASLLLLKQHRKNLSNEFAALDKISLNWLRNLMFGMCLIWLSILFGNDTTTFAMVDLFILFIGYFGIKQVGLFTNVMPQVAADELSPNREKSKYEKSNLTRSEAEKIYGQLQLAMANEKLFEDPDLTLASLAKILQVHPYVLSEVINTLAQKSFYDYVNQLRVEEFKRIALLAENQQFTLLGLAYEVGFNSKSSFNRNFKKVEGTSPVAYLKAQPRSISPAADQQLVPSYKLEP